MEQNVRDSRISMLYEGTTGIQAWTCWVARSS
jgi:alkylation response protein AidB-like acyl-CoA dehydrogenase